MKKNIFVILLFMLSISVGVAFAGSRGDDHHHHDRDRDKSVNLKLEVDPSARSTATVTNKNTNTVTNTNYNNNNQLQVQSQRQEQSINVDMKPVGDGLQAQANATEAQTKANTENTNVNANALVEAATIAQPKRDFVNPVGFVGNGYAGDYRGPWESGAQVMKVVNLIQYQNTFTTNSLKLEKQSMLFEGVRVRFRDLINSEDTPIPTDKVTVLLEKPINKTLIGFMYAEATGDEADTVFVLKKALKKVLQEGGNTVVLMGEGFTTDTDAKGWGIGFSYTQAYISADQKNSGAGAGGTGISGAKSGPETKPWMQFAVYK